MKTVVPYDGRWPQVYENEARRLGELLHPALRRIHHVGSTAVPGLLAKPIIDILIEVRALSDVDDRTADVHAAGYEARGENGIVGRRYFVKSPCDRVPVGFHVHAFVVGSHHVGRHIGFRDYLRTHPERARDYASLKAALTGSDGALVEDYAALKSPFIRETLRLASCWSSQ